MEFKHICPLRRHSRDGHCRRVAFAVRHATTLVSWLTSDFLADCHQEADLFLLGLRPTLSELPPAVRCAYCETAVRRRVLRLVASESRHRKCAVRLDNASLDLLATEGDGEAAEDHLALADVIGSEDLARAMCSLSPREQSVLDLLYRRCLSGPEAARVLGVSPEAMRQAHRRALRRLRQLLAGPGLRGGGGGDARLVSSHGDVTFGRH